MIIKMKFFKKTSSNNSHYSFLQDSMVLNLPIARKNYTTYSLVLIQIEMVYLVGKKFGRAWHQFIPRS
jgi:hypothetical protein